MEKNIIKEVTKRELRKFISESFQDYLPAIAGTIGSILAIRLFGKTILLGGLSLLVKGFVNRSCMKTFKSLTDLLVNKPETLKIEYKKIKDYYQVVIDLRIISSEYTTIDLKKNPMDQLQLDNFPAKFKFFENGYVEYYCLGELARKKYGVDIYNEVSEFIKKYGTENTELRGHGEEQVIYNTLYDNLNITYKNFNDKNRVEYEALTTMTMDDIDKFSFEISKKLDIPEDIIKMAFMVVEPDERIGNLDYPSKEEFLWDYVNKVYEEIKKRDKESLKLESKKNYYRYEKKYNKRSN